MITSMATHTTSPILILKQVPVIAALLLLINLNPGLEASRRPPVFNHHPSPITASDQNKNNNEIMNLDFPLVAQSEDRPFSSDVPPGPFKSDQNSTKEGAADAKFLDAIKQKPVEFGGKPLDLVEEKSLLQRRKTKRQGGKTVAPFEVNRDLNDNQNKGPPMMKLKKRRVRRRAVNPDEFADLIRGPISIHRQYSNRNRKPIYTDEEDEGLREIFVDGGHRRDDAGFWLPFMVFLCVAGVLAAMILLAVIGAMIVRNGDENEANNRADGGAGTGDGGAGTRSGQQFDGIDNDNNGLVHLTPTTRYKVCKGNTDNVGNYKRTAIGLVYTGTGPKPGNYKAAATRKTGTETPGQLMPVIPPGSSSKSSSNVSSMNKNLQTQRAVYPMSTRKRMAVVRPVGTLEAPGTTYQQNRLAPPQPIHPTGPARHPKGKFSSFFNGQNPCRRKSASASASAQHPPQGTQKQSDGPVLRYIPPKVDVSQLDLPSDKRSTSSGSIPCSLKLNDLPKLPQKGGPDPPIQGVTDDGVRFRIEVANDDPSSQQQQNQPPPPNPPGNPAGGLPQ